jgi:SAM-dependent methyltransferase
MPVLLPEAGSLSTMRFRLTFPRGRADLLGRLSRRRWRAEFEVPCARLSGTLVVDDESALPVPGSGVALAVAASRRDRCEIFPLDSGALPGPASWTPPPALTASEVERIPPPPVLEERDLPGPLADFPARLVPDDEVRGWAVSTGFRVIRVPRSFGIRAEIVERIPPGARRLLDVGCGGGETAAEAKRRHRGLWAEGVDRDGGSRDFARRELDAFHSGEALAVLGALAGRGEKFDVLLFADVLEHCEDPFRVLETGRRLCAPGATVIVSIPNAAAAPIVEDLVTGRFDPVGAGPEDAGHLRWFTRRSLRELLEESGFRPVSVEAMPLPAESGFSGRLAGAGLAFDALELSSVQWIAVATLAGDPHGPGPKRS